MKQKNAPKPGNQASSNKNANSNGVSLANIITIVGLGILGFFLYLGFSYSGTNASTSLLYAALMTMGIGLLIYFMLKAKSVQDNFSKWRVVEYALVGVFAMACFATVPVMSHFINVNNDSANLQNYALQDLDNLEKAISEFQDNERAQLSQLATNLHTIADASNQHAAITPELKDFITTEIHGGNNEILTHKDVEAFSDKWNSHIDNLYHYGEGKSYMDAFSQAIEKNRNRINNWKVLEIPQAINDISKLHEELGTNLSDISSSYPLHKVGFEGNHTQMDILASHQPYVVSSQAQFKEECAKRDGMNAVGWGLSLVIFFLIVFNYVVAYRSSKVSVKAGSLTHDGGIVLKI